MKAVAYARYSSDKQNETSIQAQLNAIETYCKRQEIRLVKTYCDEAVSGTSDDRPEFQNMLSELKNGIKSNFVLVHKLDRFARNRYDAAIYRRCLQELGIRLVAVDQPIDDSPEGMLMESVLEGMAEYYSRNLSRETMKGMTVRAKEARFLGGHAPYGYRIVDGQYEIEPVEAEAVRLIFEMFTDGIPMARIARYLNTQGLRTRFGNPWKSTSLHSILKNPKYIGTYVWNLTPKKVAGKRNSKIKKPENKVFRMEGGIPDVIDQSTWEAAQEKLKSRAIGTRLRIHDYALTGKVFCGLCGAPLVGDGRTTRGKQYAYYSCSAKCGLRSWPKDDLEAIVGRDLRNALLTPESREALTEKVLLTVMKKLKAWDEKREALEPILKDTETKISRLMKLVESGAGNVEIVSNRIQELQHQKDEAEEELKALMPVRVTKEMIEDYFDMCAIEVLREPTSLRRMAAQYIARIEMTNDKATTDLAVTVKCVDKSGVGSLTLVLSSHVRLPGIG